MDQIDERAGAAASEADDGAEGATLLLSAPARYAGGAGPGEATGSTGSPPTTASRGWD
ncbi:hypothetical protein GCM10025880_34250 [Methylorubrum aminovorans]|nr:hypothetical protein [Methylorubrum aminovorans]GMA77008.1 hypothetical protein GCM10025880_34250 [Methylorubrum aminovorans]